MKKFLKSLSVIALSAIALSFLGCPQPPVEDPDVAKSDPAGITLTSKINADDKDIDLENFKYGENAEVTKAKTISNLKMSGKTLTVKVSGVTLEKATDVVVVAGKEIGDGDLTIDASDLKALKVLGGGSNSIHIEDSKVKSVSVEKEGVRLAVKGTSELTSIVVKKDNAVIEAADGVVIGKIEVAKGVKAVTLNGGQIGEIKADTSAKPDVTIKGDTKVDTVDKDVTVKVPEEESENVKLPEDVKPVTLKTHKIDLSDKDIGVALNKIEYDVGKVMYHKIIDITDAFKDEIPIAGEKVELTYKIKVSEAIPSLLAKLFYYDSDGNWLRLSELDDNILVENVEAGKEYTGTYTFNIEAEKNKKVMIEFFTYEIPAGKTVYLENGAGVKTHKIDLSDKDIGVTLDKQEYEPGKIIYQKVVDITDAFKDEIPGPEEKVEMTLKFKVSETIPSLIAQLCYLDNEGNWLRLSTLSENILVENVEAGKEYTVTYTFDIEAEKENKVMIQFFTYEIPEEKYVFLENGAGVPSEGQYFKLETTDDGIKIILKDPEGLVHRATNAGAFEILDENDLSVITYQETVDGVTVLKYEYNYPFTTKDQYYYVRFSGGMDTVDGKDAGWPVEILKIKATSGRNLFDYLKKDALKKNAETKMDVEFNSAEGVFHWGFKSEFTKLSDIYVLSKVDKLDMDKGLTLGGLYWSNAVWWGGNGFSYDKTADTAKVTIYGYIGETDLFEGAKTNSLDFIWKETPTGADWDKYNNTYCSYMSWKFTVPEYPTSYYQLPQCWSELKTNPRIVESTKNLDLDAAMVAGVKDVEKFISTKEELKAVLQEVYDEYASLMSPSEQSTYSVRSRSIVDIPEDKAKSIMAAAKQTVETAQKLVAVYNDLSAFNGDIKVDFDQTINIGELTFSQWLGVVCDTYDAVNMALYGITSGTYRKTIELGTVPEGGWWISADWDWETGTRTYNWKRTNDVAPVEGLAELPEGKYLEVINGQYGYFGDVYNEEYDYWENNFISLGNVTEEYADCYISRKWVNGDNYEYYWKKDEKMPITIDPAYNDYLDMYGLSTWWDSSWTTRYYGFVLSEFNVQSSASVMSQLKESLSSMDVTLDEILSFLDSVVTIKNFYFDADIDVDFSVAALNDKKTAANIKAGSGTLALVLNGGIADVNSAINKYLPLFGVSSSIKIDSPVKALAFDVEAKADASVAYGDIQTIMNSTDGKDVTIKNSSANAAAEVVVKAAVCTATKKGGIITIEVLANVDDVVVLKSWSGSISDDDALFAELDKIGTVKVTVSDGTKDTLSATYTPAEIVALFN